MSNARTQHPNAPLTPEGRRRMVACVLEQRWTIEATAERFQVDAKTVRKWRDRFLAEGDAGLHDRSSRPHRSPNQTGPRLRNKVLQLRRRHRWGADHIAHETGLAASTVQSILNAAGVGRLDRGDRATNTEAVRRYQRERPGELIHVDVKKISGIPNGGGWRLHGRGNDNYKRCQHAGYRYIHSAIDDRTRLVYSEIHHDEQAVTAVGFWHRAVAWFQLHGITCERVLTDNGSCYKSGLWHRACNETGTTVKKTRPRRRRPTARSVSIWWRSTGVGLTQARFDRGVLRSICRPVWCCAMARTGRTDADLIGAWLEAPSQTCRPSDRLAPPSEHDLTERHFEHGKQDRRCRRRRRHPQAHPSRRGHRRRLASCSANREFGADAGGHAELLGWLRSHGTVAAVGIEGTGHYGAALTRSPTRRRACG